MAVLKLVALLQGFKIEQLITVRNPQCGLLTFKMSFTTVRVRPSE